VRFFFIDNAEVKRENGALIGKITYDTTWERYRFEPKNGVSFDESDLRDLADGLRRIKK
jgi:hypothetical protein